MASTNRDEISRLELLHAAHPDGLVFPHLADAYRRAGRYSQAESVLSAGLRRHADYSSAHLVMGRLRLDQGKRQEAVAAFHRVLELDPENPVALELLGRMAAEEGRMGDAVDYLRRLARVKPSEELSRELAELEHRDREGRQARRPGDPDPPEAARGNGGGEPQEAGPRDGQPPTPLPEPGEVVTETMAELYARQGLHDRAEAVYRELLERDPGNARLQSKLAEVGSRRFQAPPDEPASSHSRDTGERGRASDPGPNIRDYLSGVVAWAPEAATGPPAEEDLEPWASAPVSSASGQPLPPADRETDSPGPQSRSDATAGSEPEGAAEAAHADEEAAAEGERWKTEPAGTVPTDSLPPEPGSPPPGPAEEPPPGWLQSGPAPTPSELGLVEDDLEGADPHARTLIALTDMLVGLLEYRDPYFRGSSSLTRLLATNVAREMGLDATDRVHLALAAVLRDLGRLAVGGRLVKSPKLSHTREGQRKIQRHVDLALELLDGIDLPESVRLAVRHHHERWDGDGYPDRLAGEEIPLLARMLAAVDSFAAMLSPRTYRLPRKVGDAAREMRDAAGIQYDPQVVDALLRLLERKDRPPRPHLEFAQRQHILLVDRDQPGALVTAAKLCTAGYLAEVMTSADSARERIRRVPVAALVVSAGSGPETVESLIRNLRRDPLFTAMPIVVTDAETVALRVRLLESGADVCFPPGISYGELKGTLGALVRRTLRSRESGSEWGEEEAPWLALQGDIKDFPLAWLLQVMKYDGRTAGIGIRTAAGQGAIYIQKGDVIHAQIRGGSKGEPALRRMLTWEEGRFTVQPEATPREQSIDSSIMHLLLSQAVEQDHATAGVFGTVSDQG